MQDQAQSPIAASNCGRQDPTLPDIRNGAKAKPLPLLPAGGSRRAAGTGGTTNGRWIKDMLQDIKRLFAELSGGAKPESHFDGDDYRVAAAALLVHVATLEGDLSDTARTKLRALLQSQFSLDEGLTDELVE